ncbi:hypothetical protein B0I72DRAFT_137129 [Yarrowia lipolytica]|jgi:hypothetical protein|uniref:YALI0E04422p n=2 Tax=Yarrowia lipolytica TaxID=4952 RepID=Q6C722_YARLI|nr:YALI0E04422p [Yarrowia lipolytica CLIB122]KAB8286232.1 hypothetical protein BKA91DRAFT_132144 [Yarrowia lipolytica]KAE8171556.1 hypothetical protein BKA90DRAFT_138970 [Yarrowia lipolytica]KAJ8056519.1 hypothetical protein LXG23DRAFT_33414 [Yarrowia lipolytica]QNQ00358.1 Hypothetical protein YALI2_E01673g [Yarrowia lipolytica]RDW26563.1 hypothetical protein B0I71DRAFT_130732 [Yarrowia lipolytica]|eukprot:XP_503540.1 YALI0E04422p [Yarrowia lipolytica CLIB122]
MTRFCDTVKTLIKEPSFYQFTGTVAGYTLFAAAFPVVAAIHTARGVALLKNKSLESCECENKLAKKFDISNITLNEWYSPITLLFPLFKRVVEPLGPLAVMWARYTGLVGEMTDKEVNCVFNCWAKISLGYIYVTGAICFTGLSVWSYRRQTQRHIKKQSIVGVPEVTLALFTGLLFV